MEYLVESHLGGYYVSDSDPVVIMAYCEQCGDSDNIILSWNKGKIFDALLQYFSSIKKNSEQLKNDKKNDLLRDELIDYLMYLYDNDRYMINELVEDNIITREEQIKLLKQVSISQKKQFELLKNIYYSDGFVRIKKKII